jgi:hypothetical protein
MACSCSKNYLTLRPRWGLVLSFINTYKSTNGVSNMGPNMYFKEHVLKLYSAISVILNKISNLHVNDIAFQSVILLTLKVPDKGYSIKGKLDIYILLKFN